MTFAYLAHFTNQTVIMDEHDEKQYRTVLGTLRRTLLPASLELHAGSFYPITEYLWIARACKDSDGWALGKQMCEKREAKKKVYRPKRFHRPTHMQLHPKM